MEQEIITIKVILPANPHLDADRLRHVLQGKVEDVLTFDFPTRFILESEVTRG